MTIEATPSRAVIFHGYDAAPSDHWFPWLADELTSRGISTEVPAFPEPATPQVEAWEAVVQKNLGRPDTGTAVVAHSLGCITVLRHLASLAPGWRLGHLVLVAGFNTRLPAFPQVDSFIPSELPLADIAAGVENLVVLRSDDDELVPAEFTDDLGHV